MSEDPHTQVIRADRRQRRHGDRVLAPTFTVVEGPSIGALHVLDPSRRAHRIGRSDDADIQVNAASVSRYHAIAIVASRGDETSVRIEDNNSTNGIKVNGNQVASIWLETGDKLRMGDVLLRFQWMTEEEIQYASGMSTRLEAAARDPLTRLLARAFVTDRLPGVVHSSERRGRPLCCLLLDLDHFKAVNDAHGHLAGDAVIRRAARAIAKSLRANDFAVRYGGEEFLVVLLDTEVAPAMLAAQRIREAIARIDLEDVVPGLGVSASQGLALRAVGESIDDWIARADRALYAAKASGRDRVEVAPAGVASPVGEIADSTQGAEVVSEELDAFPTLEATDVDLLE